MLTNYIINEMLSLIGGLNSSGRCYLALSSTEPTITGTNVTEPKGNGYSRAMLYDAYANTANLFINADNVLTNNKTIYFEEATGDYGPISESGSKYVWRMSAYVVAVPYPYRDVPFLPCIY